VKQVQIALPTDLEDYAKEKAAKNYESLAAYIRRLILEDKKRAAA